MHNDKVKWSVDGSIAVITIDNPPMNTLSIGVLDGLRESFDHLEQVESLRAVIITGAGEKAFVAGADIKEFPSWTAEVAEDLSKKGQILFSRIENFPLPVIAAINGYALGGGLELALSCDIRIAANNAKMGLPEVTLGIIPAYGGTQRLCRTIPVGIAKKMIYTAEIMNAEKALSIGLVEQVTEQNKLMEEALNIANKIASNAPIAIRGAKRAINSERNLSIQQGLSIELEVAKQVFSSEDKLEGVDAFINKRIAQFKNK